MKKLKFLIFIFIGITLFIIPNISKATTQVTRDVYSNNGSMKFTFSGVEVNSDHQYEFALTEKNSDEIETWHSISTIEENNITVDITALTKDFKKVISASDTGYITIKDTTDSDKIILEDYQVDLKLPYLQVANYTVLKNGTKFSNDNCFNVPMANAQNSIAYYQYEKITDEGIIAKYKEIISREGKVQEMQNMLSTDEPKSGWSEWKYWNGYGADEAGFGYPQTQIEAPGTGLYYLWLFFSGKDVKNVYGYVLVDNLEPDIALQSVSIKPTLQIEIGDKVTLEPKFTPENATNKILTWTSNDESVATVDNGGTVTAKKLGSAVITATSQDGNKQTTCTVTVVEEGKGSDNGSYSGGSGDNGSKNNGSNNDGSNGQGGQNNDSQNSGKKDPDETTVNNGKLPYTGKVEILTILVILIIGGVSAYIRYYKLKDI